MHALSANGQENVDVAGRSGGGPVSSCARLSCEGKGPASLPAASVHPGCSSASRALASGARGRTCESCHPDFGVAAPKVAGSTPARPPCATRRQAQHRTSHRTTGASGRMPRAAGGGARIERDAAALHPMARRGRGVRTPGVEARGPRDGCSPVPASPAPPVLPFTHGRACRGYILAIPRPRRQARADGRGLSGNGSRLPVRFRGPGTSRPCTSFRSRRAGRRVPVVAHLTLEQATQGPSAPSARSRQARVADAA